MWALIADSRLLSLLVGQGAAALRRVIPARRRVNVIQRAWLSPPFWLSRPRQRLASPIDRRHSRVVILFEIGGSCRPFPMTLLLRLPGAGNFAPSPTAGGGDARSSRKQGLLMAT